jgi:Tfp pilus assembly protein PilW
MNKHRNAGFSLVELMVAMVLALIVIGAVIALVLSMMRANNQTISATRLTQELRATAALIEAICAGRGEWSIR